MQLGQTKLGPDGRMHPFSRLADDIESEERMWREYYELEAPEEASLPMGYDQSLSEFEKLLVLRCLRMDRVTVGITRCVHAHTRAAQSHGLPAGEKALCLTAAVRPSSPAQVRDQRHDGALRAAAGAGLPHDLQAVQGDDAHRVRAVAR